MRILLTGATGVIGRRFVSFLHQQNYQLLLLVRNESKAKELFGPLISADFQLLSWDNLASDQLTLFQPTVVFHLAGYSSSRDDIDTLEQLISSNILTGTRLLHRLTNLPSVKYFINIGSSTEYYNNSSNPEPTYFYSATKTAFRSILSFFAQKMEMKTIHVVLYSVYGMKSENKRIMDYLLDGLSCEQPIKLSPGEQKNDFIHIDDVISAFNTMLENLTNLVSVENVFYLGSGKSYRLKEIAELLEKAVETKLNLEWGGLSYRDRDMMFSEAPLEKNTIPWKPLISLEEGISKYVKLSL